MESSDVNGFRPVLDITGVNPGGEVFTIEGVKVDLEGVAAACGGW